VARSVAGRRAGVTYSTLFLPPIRWEDRPRNRTSDRAHEERIVTRKETSEDPLNSEQQVRPTLDGGTDVVGRSLLHPKLDEFPEFLGVHQLDHSPTV
jgi:hypothetical protein